MPLKIYYLDDESDLLEIFAETFTCTEVTVSTFSNPDQALQAIKEFPPDIVFLDYRLPNTTGDKIALQIDPRIPKALITGDLSADLKAKFDAVFIKPISQEKIELFIQSFMPKKMVA